MADEVRISVERLRRFCTATLVKIGVTPDDAAIITDCLIDADLRGIKSHGLVRFATYIDYMRTDRKSAVAIQPRITVVKDEKATALVDGGNGLGHLVSVKAMRVAINKAKEYGISSVGVFNSNHNGAEAYYAMMALKHDMIGYCMTVGGRNNMFPWASSARLLANNPLAFAFPANQEWPVVFDAASSVVAQGWFLLAMKNNQKIPMNWGATEEGESTDDPEKATVLRPLGYSDGVGYKGTGMALLIAILSGVLTGGAVGTEMPDGYSAGNYKNIGHFMGCIRIDHFMPVEKFKARMDKLIREIKTSKKMKGFDRIYLPGEKEFELREENLEKGVPVSDGVLKELKDLGLDNF